jgi:hypothetical protein
LNIILSELEFDEDIIVSIEELSDGFEMRKNEIIYHLYCIHKEIPMILRDGHRDYQNIGRQMSLDCSPERNRKIVNNKLRKILNGITVNCELHTKMRRLSSNAPDRIYFCPSLPDSMNVTMAGKIYIYKITKHA